jgi:hypothetical protein
MTKKGGKSQQNSFGSEMQSLTSYLQNQIQMLNNSKIFAGLMILTLNVASKFTTIHLSKTMESYLKYTFSRNVLIFVIAWMGTREISVALIITLCFIFAMDYLFNEESTFCIFPESFTDYHISLLEEKSKDKNKEVTEEEIKKAEEVLEKAKNQKKSLIASNFIFV